MSTNDFQVTVVVYLTIVALCLYGLNNLCHLLIALKYNKYVKRCHVLLEKIQQRRCELLAMLSVNPDQQELSIEQDH